MLKDFEVIEYFLDKNNNITGHALHNKKRKPEYTKNIVPKNFDFKYQDKYGNYRYKLENNTPVLNTILPTEHQLELKEFRKTDILKVIKILVRGIENPNDSAFQTLKNKLSKINL